MMKKASVADVARLAGVSTATVSRVTTTPEKVAEETREKVEKAIKELKFVKSISGQSLRQQNTRNILVVVNNIGNIYWSEVFHGVHERAEEAGYSIMISTTDARGQMGTFIDRLRTGRVDGIILLAPYEFQQEELDILNQDFDGRPPLVAFFESKSLADVPHVYVDNEMAGYRATKHLIESGHEHIAHAVGPDTMVCALERLAGFKRAMKEHGLEVHKKDLWPSEFHRDGGRRVARRIMRTPKPPSAIFCCTDEIAMGCISELETLGVRVPQDISIMGFDNNAFADVFVPALTTMSQPREGIGAAAMELMLKVLRAEDNEGVKAKENWPPEVELKVNLAKRASVRDITFPLSSAN